ncbi:MAG: hypothetical protein JW969_04710 [Spirochaetales bacterium]|nr:hypothetical protein [Spirochaetales bacterium]
MKEFNFKYTLISIKAVIDDTNTLSIKQGLKTWKTEILRLKHLYVITHPDTGYEMILTHEDDNGKLKKIRLNSNFGQPGFQELIDELLKLRPDIDIRDKSVKEAHKIMGTINFVRLAPVIVYIIVVGFIAVFFLPSLMHGLDSSEQILSVRDLGIPAVLKAHNVTITGACLYIENYMAVTDSKGNIRNYIPVVPDTFIPTDPIYLVLETNGMTEPELQNLAAGDTFKGVIRNIFWEGLSLDQKAFFKSDLKLNLAEGVLLMQYDADVKEDLNIALIILGIVAVIMLAFVIIVAIRMPK